MKDNYKYISKLDDETAEHLKAIFNYSYQKWSNGEIKNKPAIIDVVRTLINGLYASMVEEGEIVE